MSGNVYIDNTDANAQQLQAAGIQVPQKRDNRGLRIPTVTVMQDAALQLNRLPGYETYRIELEGDSSFALIETRGGTPVRQGLRCIFDPDGVMHWVKFNGVLEEVYEAQPKLVALLEHTFQLINSGEGSVVPSTIPESLVASAHRVESEWVARAQKRGGLITQMTVVAEWSGKPAGHWLSRPSRTRDTAMGQVGDPVRMDRGAEITALPDGTVKIIPLRSKVQVDREKGVLRVVKEHIPDRPPYEGPLDKCPTRLAQFKPAARAALEALQDGTPVGKVNWL